MKKYPKYKDSGVEWIGEVPEGWEVKRLAFAGRFSKGGGISRSELTDKGLPAILYGDIYTKYNVCVKKVVHSIADETAQKAVVITKNTLLFTGSGETKEDIGKCVVYLGETIAYAGGDVIIFETSSCDGLFLSYFLNTPGANSEKARFSKGEIVVHTYASSLRNLFVSFPSLPEQTAITAYLDRKTAQIDQTIAEKERLIELFREERQAIINHAVTKGIRPGVKMKDSGVAWIGEVPEGWAVKKLKYVASLKSGESIVSEQILEEAPFPVFGGNGLRGYFTDYTHEGHYVLIGRQGALCGNINYANGKFWASEHAVVVSIKDSSDTFWLGELLRSMNLNQYSLASAQPGLAVEKIQNLHIPVPPISEQVEISHFFKVKTAQIDTAILGIQQEIALLQEYRQALIFEAVTGKIDVRDTI